MTEAIPNAATMAPTMNQEPGWISRHAREFGAVLALTASTLGIVACGSSHKASPAETTAAAAANAGLACEGTNLLQNRADTVFGSPEAFFPALATSNKSGEDVLVSKTEASHLLREQICGDTRSL